MTIVDIPFEPSVNAIDASINGKEAQERANKLFYKQLNAKVALLLLFSLTKPLRIIKLAPRCLPKQHQNTVSCPSG
ncbi:hypothetical protein [Vibrio sp. 99-8-1]|uniref:hypothetical protein n=1 Tax=Vibrio sp. 99-8-1 TaxID=2607602 RepID=UPI001493ABD6|nr:hypothetical protein [Vibrio sp. 99-8-1]NOI66476.1 hypothetical protein [Vibrio sp. 99-8-1]